MLEKLFTSKARVKILQFLIFEKHETHIREISNSLGLHPSAVKRETDNLSKLDLVRKKNNILYFNVSSPISEDLKNIFVKTDAVAYPLMEAVDNNRIEFALIFGSFAKGNFGPESDIDLLVIGSISQSKILDLLNRAEEKTKREINPVVWTRERLKKSKDTALIRDIAKNKKIFLKGTENEFRAAMEGR